jgi:hypothetical protein
VTDFPLSFTADSLVAEARERTGELEDFGSSRSSSRWASSSTACETTPC